MSNVSPKNERTENQTETIATLRRLYVADTVALVLRLEKRVMGNYVRQAFLAVEKGEANLLVPAMALTEIMYLSQRKRITATLAEVEKYLATYPAYREAPLTLAIVKTAQGITDIPELHDRLIAATASHHNAILLTNDLTISASTQVQTLW